MVIELTTNTIVTFLLVSFVALLLMAVYTKKATKTMREEKEKAEAERIARETTEKEDLTSEEEKIKNNRFPERG